MRVEVWFQDEARIGQKNSLARVWGQTGSRPVAPKDLGFASAYLFGAVCPSEGKAAALIMPICNTAAMNHHLSEISSQGAAPVQFGTSPSAGKTGSFRTETPVPLRRTD